MRKILIQSNFHEDMLVDGCQVIEVILIQSLQRECLVDQGRSDPNPSMDTFSFAL
jgi:hypothetical protein